MIRGRAHNLLPLRSVNQGQMQLGRLFVLQLPSPGDLHNPISHLHCSSQPAAEALLPHAPAKELQTRQALLRTMTVRAPACCLRMHCMGASVVRWVPADSVEPRAKRAAAKARATAPASPGGQGAGMVTAVNRQSRRYQQSSIIRFPSAMPLACTHCWLNATHAPAPMPMQRAHATRAFIRCPLSRQGRPCHWPHTWRHGPPCRRPSTCRCSASGAHACSTCRQPYRRRRESPVLHWGRHWE
jgi:hypothetical protein